MSGRGSAARWRPDGGRQTRGPGGRHLGWHGPDSFMWQEPAPAVPASAIVAGDFTSRRRIRISDWCAISPTPGARPATARRRRFLSPRGPHAIMCRHSDLGPRSKKRGSARHRRSDHRPVRESTLAVRLLAIVLAQRVVAEIGGEVAPHRVDVVGAVLGVVVLDQGDRPVDAEVIGLARRERARPGEAEALPAPAPSPAASGRPEGRARGCRGSGPSAPRRADATGRPWRRVRARAAGRDPSRAAGWRRSRRTSGRR